MVRANDIIGLDCAASIESGARLVLEGRWAEMCALRTAALDWSDVEGVHDMRVASRRLRSALLDFKPYFRKRHLRPMRKGLEKIAEALGNVRDADVAIIALEKLAASAPPEVVPGIERLADEHRQRREKARAVLSETISEDYLPQLRTESFTALDQAIEASPGSGDGLSVLEDNLTGTETPPQDLAESFREAGREIIADRLDELQDLSTSLYRPLKIKPLHEFRIAAKRLRYALELFSPCWDHSLKAYAEEVAELQTSLGELHDCDVWIAALGERLYAQRKQRPNTPMALEVQQYDRRAAMWLLRHFAKERTKFYRAALARWHAWENYKFLAHLSLHLSTSHAPSFPEHKEPSPTEIEEALITEAAPSNIEELREAS